MSNLPPGVTESMIPGNRPEDIMWDKVLDWILDSGLTPDQVIEAIVKETGVNQPAFYQPEAEERDDY